MNELSKNNSPIVDFFSRVADLVVLNLITLLCCIPVLTIGASISACHYSARKLMKDEMHVTTAFWKSFKENLVRSGVIFLIFAVVIAVSVFIYISSPAFFAGSMLAMVRGFEIFAAVAAVMVSLWAFPLQAGFIYSLRQLLSNSAILAIRYLPRTIGMMALWAVPVVMVLSFRFIWLMIFILLGLSVPVYLSAKLYRPVFEDIEEMISSRNDLSK